MANNEKLLLTISEAAKILNVSKATLYMLWRENRGPQYRLMNRKKMVPVEELHAWIQTLPKGQTRKAA